MKEGLKWFAAGIGVLVLILALTWVFQGNEFFLYQYFAPKRAEAERKVFEESRSFNVGMAQELENMQRDYLTQKDPNSKKAIAAMILNRASGFNLDDPAVSRELRDFINQLKQERNNPNANQNGKY